MATPLCLLSGLWGYLLVQSGMSLTTTVIAAASFPLDFILLSIGLLASRKSQMKSSVPLGTTSRKSETKKYQITVLGPFTKPETIHMASGSTIQDVLQEMRRRHRIPDLARIKHYVVFPACKFASLSPTDVLQDVGIRDLSVLHIRTSVIGGSSHSARSSSSIPAGSAGDTAGRSDFTNSTGNFKSSRPDVWRPAGNGLWQCQVCPHHDPIETRRIARHEGLRHQENLERYDRQNAASGSHSSEPSSSSSTRAPLRSDQILGPLARTLAQIKQNPHPQESRHSYVNQDTGVVNWDSVDFDTQPEESVEVRNIALLAQNLAEYLKEGDLDHDSDDDSEERSQVESSESDNDSDLPSVHARKSHRVDPDAVDSPWFPWPDKETCILDILRHIPRCSFSKKQNAAIHWAMLALGLKDLPSDRVMDDVDKALQKLCGIQSIRYSGKLGHVYYVNDLAAIIAQEMANPTTRKNLHFFPEDSRPSLSQAWQASRWLNEIDSDLTTPMIRVDKQDFYIHEPTLLSNGVVCMPTRWFKRGDRMLAKAWKMRPSSNEDPNFGWIVEADCEFEIPEADLLISFPLLSTTYLSRKIPDPRKIHAIESKGQLERWTKTDPAEGNRWRKVSAGHRVLAFPIWLYCDDTSGNTSKKWNKHNSFLFTAAGLPRKFVHRESNIHFLSTSNIAPPLEMLDGIVDQLEDCQKRGIWCWDAEHKELVLVIPFVLAMLGDNPMQSEFACHIGFRGKFFCRVCWVKGDPEEPEEEEDQEGNTDISDKSDAPSIASDILGQKKPLKKKKKTKKKDESVLEMVSRITQFMTQDKSRSRFESQQELRSQFQVATVVGGQAGYNRRKTASGVKDTFQGSFLERVFAISTKKGRSKPQKQADVNALLRTFPPDITSPVWRIRDFDPHQDTPVEILHVILLGFVKYFWRDAIARVKKSDKELLISRLSSFNVSGLGISPLAGHTLVNYSGSLTGRDFRAVVQAAPFVLQGLLPAAHIELWTALSAVVTLVWQPHILDIDKYTQQLDDAINHFLNCTCRMTLQWFNKPKFHVILHLPAHIKRFGPAMLFATEGFESFNAIIRSCSVHSNRHAPSLDIASRMARGNRVRHLLSRGFFPIDGDFHSKSENHPSRSPWMDISLQDLKKSRWLQAASAPLQFMELNSFASRLLGWEVPVSTAVPLGSCRGLGQAKVWTKTKAAGTGIQAPATKVFTAESVTLMNGDSCSIGDWVVWIETTGQISVSKIGCVAEIIQIIGSPAHGAGMPDFLLVSRTIVGEAHDVYKMRRLQPIPDEYWQVQIKDIKCTVNVQHNCADNKCRSTRTRIVFNEREKTSNRALAVEHNSKSDLVVNTAQMRDAAYLDKFRWTPPALVRKNIIHEAAEKAYSERQKTKKPVAAVVQVEGDHSSTEPARKKTRTTGDSSNSIPSHSSSSSLRRVLASDNTPKDSNSPRNISPPQTYSFSNAFQSSFEYP